MREVPSWDDYHMGIARVVASRSRDPKMQVGVVIVDQSNHIVATGYNGFLPGFPDNSDLWDDKVSKHRCVNHAEINAVAHAARKGHSLDGATAYVTLAPCGPCLKAMAAAGIRRIVCGPVDKIRDEQNDAILISRLTPGLELVSLDGVIDEHATV